MSGTHSGKENEQQPPSAPTTPTTNQASLPRLPGIESFDGTPPVSSILTQFRPTPSKYPGKAPEYPAQYATAMPSQAPAPGEYDYESPTELAYHDYDELQHEPPSTTGMPPQTQARPQFARGNPDELAIHRYSPESQSGYTSGSAQAPQYARPDLGMQPFTHNSTAQHI